MGHKLKPTIFLAQIPNFKKKLYKLRMKESRLKFWVTKITVGV